MAAKDVSNITSLRKADPTLPSLMNFGAIRREHNVIWPPASDEISLDFGLFRDLLRLALEHIRVDEQYYLRLYPDVGEAVANGSFNNPRHHYIEFGYFEDRLPFRITVDDEFYFRSNPDIKASVDVGAFPSAQVHFERHGFREGRLPWEGWSLLGN
jgi:hypothetical protein